MSDAAQLAMELVVAAHDEIMDKIGHMQQETLRTQELLSWSEVEAYYMEVGATVRSAFDLAMTDIESQMTEEDKRENQERRRAAQRGML
jgi:hypothetical protein